MEDDRQLSADAVKAASEYALRLTGDPEEADQLVVEALLSWSPGHDQRRPRCLRSFLLAAVNREYQALARRRLRAAE